MDFKKDYKALVKTIKKSLAEAGKPSRNEDIAAILGYNRSYFSTLLSGNGVVTADHIKALKLNFAEMLGKSTQVKIESTPEHLFERIIERQAASNAAIKIVLAELAEMKSKASGASFVSEFSALQRACEDQLPHELKELKALILKG